MNRTTLLPVLALLAAAACGDDRPASREDSTGSGAAAAAAARSERRTAGTATAEPAGDTPIDITASIGGREIAAKGLGACEHAAEGSIYERPASLWTARYAGRESDDLRHLSITFWRERSGTESVTMALQVGSDVHRIATVEGGEKQGSGAASLEGNASAGTLVVEGTSAEGKPVQVRAKCARFTTMVAEGG